MKACPGPECEQSTPGMTGCGLSHLTAGTQRFEPDATTATSQTLAQSSSSLGNEQIRISSKSFKVLAPSSVTSRDFWFISCLYCFGRKLKRKTSQENKIWEKTEPSMAGPQKSVQEVNSLIKLRFTSLPSSYLQLLSSISSQIRGHFGCSLYFLRENSELNLQ